jgi:hypothetical protein
LIQKHVQIVVLALMFARWRRYLRNNEP